MEPSAAATTLTLVVEKGPRKGETVECRPGRRVAIGRVVRGNTFTIKDAGISQSHLSIDSAGAAGWALTDLGSSNGTLLNGVRIQHSYPAPLRHGDAIKIGEETAILVRIAETEATAPPAEAGPRRNPRRGRAAAAVEPPREEAARSTRGSTRRAAADVGNDAGEESVKEPSKKPAARRGRGRGRGRGTGRSASRKAAATPSCLDLVSEESDKEDSDPVENQSLKEVKQEILDSVQIPSVRGSEAGGGRGRGATRKATAMAGALEEEQARVEDERFAPLRVEDGEEEDIAGANPGVEEGGVDMENMTLEEWFDRMEKYLPKVINQIAEEVISEIKAKAEKFNEYVGNSLDSEQRDVGGGGFIGLM